MYYQNRPYRSNGSYKRKSNSGKVVKVVVIVLLALTLLPLLTLGIGRLVGNDETVRYKTDVLEISDQASAGYCNVGTNYAEVLSLDKKIFTVNLTPGSVTNNAYISKASSGAELRLYAGDNADGNVLTVESEKNIVYIEIEFSSSSGAYSLNGEKFTSADTRHIINSSSFTIKNIVDTGSSKVLIKNIYIVYED